MAKAIAFVVLLLISPAAYAVQYTVGDSSGWTATGVDYATWATGKSFVVGDTLLFNYAAMHAVDEVSETDFKSCAKSNSLASYSSSPTTITLNATGSRYFICPTGAHCSGGQKLSVTVSAAGSPSPPAGSAPSTPAGTTPATPGTHSSPPPPSSSAATLARGDSLMVGLVSLVLMALVGLMS